MLEHLIQQTIERLKKIVDTTQGDGACALSLFESVLDDAAMLDAQNVLADDATELYIELLEHELLSKDNQSTE